MAKDNNLQNLILFLTGNIYLKLQKYENAKDFYLKIYQTQPENGEINEALGCLFLSLGDFNTAKSYFIKALKSNNSNQNTFLGLALIHEKEKQYLKAVKYFSMALRYKEEKWIIYKIGILYIFLEDFEKSKILLEGINDIYCDEDSYLFFMGYTYSRLGQYDMAIKFWVMLKDKHPDDEDLNLNILKARYLYGRKLICLKEFEKAIYEWDIYVQSHKDDVNTRKNLAQLYFRVGLIKFKNKDNIRAVKEDYFDKAVRYDQENPQYLFYLALTEIELKNNNDAQQLLEKLIVHDSANKGYLYYLAITHINIGNKQKAISILNSIVSAAPDDMYSTYSKRIIANEFIKDKHFHEAVTLLEQLV